jgi:hypothetical protein
VFTSVPNSQPFAKVCLNAAPSLLQHAGSGLSLPGSSQGVRATWDTASVCTAHPTAGQYLAFAVTLLPLICSASARSTWQCGWPAPQPATASTPPNSPGCC